jgi:hypothetical protein
MRSKPKKSTKSAESLANLWDISPLVADKTLKVTTQREIRSAVHPLHRRCRTKQQQFRYNRLNARFYLDSMFAKRKSLRGSTCAQVFVNGVGFGEFIRMNQKQECGDALEDLFSDVGVPTALHNEGAKEMTLSHWKYIRDKHGGIKQALVEPYSPWQNRLESTMRDTKKKY